ncbi:MAG: peptidylprolyl isomerase [Bacteroidales bacterium]
MKKSILILMISLFASSAFAQQGDEILVEIGPEKVTVDEFLHIYNKNNDVRDDRYNLDSLKSYMDLFVNFKLKVVEAKNMGLDTVKSFKQELEGYRSQLAEPYLTDKSVEEELLQEAYERKQYDVKASHILIEAGPDASPEDTLKAYKKIKSVREKAVDGEDFSRLAVKHSEDKSVKTNEGNLGWFTVFGMVYPFESAAYETPVGEVSDIVRTRFGYHIIKVEDKRAAKGKVRTAHIMVLKPKNASEEQLQKAEERVAEIKEKLDAGEDFHDLAKEYSEDRRSARTGGMMPWFGVGGKMISVFEDAAYELDTVGEISDLVTTNYGYHFIKLVDKEEIGSFEEEKPKLSSRISNSARASRSKDVLVENLKKEYNAKVYQENLDALAAKVTDSIFYGTWDAEEALHMDKPVLSFAGTQKSQGDFAEFLRKFNRKSPEKNLSKFVDEKFDEFVSKAILDYEEANLENKYSRFNYLLKEYHDGILLFDVTDKMVWSKAVEDTSGLQAYYEAHKEKYMWDTRYEVKKVNLSDKKLAKEIKKMFKKQDDLSWEEIDSLYNTDDEENVSKAYWKVYEKGSDAQITEMVKDYSKKLNKKGEVLEADDESVLYIRKHEPSVKELSEARGLVTADYQNQLEKDWLEALHDKYEITIHEDVLKKIAEQ